MSLVLLGMSILLVFLSMLSYIVDAYLFATASGLAANTIVRSVVGAGMSLFEAQIFVAMNMRFASLLLACVAVALMPIPFVLFKYGPALRAHSSCAH